MSDSTAQTRVLSGKKTALITGASRGIGRAIALELGKMGANVCINYLSNETAAKEVVELLKHEYGTQTIAIAADVSKGAEVERLFSGDATDIRASADLSKQCRDYPRLIFCCV